MADSTWAAVLRMLRRLVREGERMRTRTLAGIGVLATLAVGCGGGDGSTHLKHPTLDQDYAGNFAGTWDGAGP